MSLVYHIFGTRCSSTATTTTGTHLRFSALNSFSRNRLKCSLPAASLRSSRTLKLHRLTRRCGMSFLTSQTHPHGDTYTRWPKLRAGYGRDENFFAIPPNWEILGECKGLTVSWN